MQRVIGVILEFCLEFTDGEPGVMHVGQVEKEGSSFIRSKFEMPFTYSNGHMKVYYMDNESLLYAS